MWSGMRMIVDSVWKNKRTSVRACHGVSKCREKNESIQLSNGKIVPCYEIIDKEFEIETTQGFKKAYGSDNGKQKIKVITLGNGTVIKITDNHPLYLAKKSGKRNRYVLGRKEFLNVIGFTSDINKGDCIAVPVKTNTKSHITLPEEEIKLLAYMIGDGSTRVGVTMTTADNKVVEDIYLLAKYYGTKIKKYNKYDYRFTMGQTGGRPNPIIDLMRANGIMDHLAKDKYIPPNIFRLNEKQICIFLVHLYMCDGHVICKKGIGNRTVTQVVYTTVSIKLANDLYILLKRIGIKRPLIRKEKTTWTYKGIKKTGECYKIFILILKDTQLFAEKVKLWGHKGDRLNGIINAERTGALRPYGKWRDDCLPNMYWEDVKNITIEEAETVAITVPGIETFITPYAYEHNTFTAATIAITFFNLYKNAIVITTAPTNRQVELLLWKDIRSIYSKQVKIPLRGECMTMGIKSNTDSYVTGFSTDRATSIEGFHAPYILWILDEAKGLPQWVYDAVEGSMTGGTARILEISTTDGADQQCPLRRHQTDQRKFWNCIKLSSFDSPFVKVNEFPEFSQHRNKDLFKFGKPETGAEWPDKLQSKIQIVTTEEVKEKKELWFKNEYHLWETKILGDFSSIGTDNVIPLKWVLSAVDSEVDEGEGITKHGFDVARMGDDKCILTTMVGKTVPLQVSWGKKKIPYSVGRLMAETELDEVINVDACGLGSGAFDDLAEFGHATIGLDSASNAFDTVKFKNLRAEIWWNARQIFERQFEEGNVISIPNDPELIMDLTGLQYKPMLSGQYIMEPKETYKKRLGRSPDKGDSFVYCVYEAPVYEEEYYGEADDDTDIFI